MLGEGRLALVMEGGYNLISLARDVHTVLEVLTGGEIPELLGTGVREADKKAAESHRSAFSDDD